MKKAYAIFLSCCFLMAGCLGEEKSSDNNLSAMLLLGSAQKDTITITGTLDGITVMSRASASGSLMNIAKPDIMRSVADGTVDTVLAVPITYPIDWTTILDGAQSFPIENDQFILELDRTKRWVLLLIDSTQMLKEDQIVAFLSMQTTDVGENRAMMLFPLDQATGSIDMGTIEMISDDEAMSSEPFDDWNTAFDLPLDTLREIAATDTLFKNIKNVYVNADVEGLLIVENLSWTITDMDLINNIFLDVTSYGLPSFSSGFYITPENSYFTYEGVRDKDYVVSIIPPATVYDATKPEDEYTYFSNGFSGDWDNIDDANMALRYYGSGPSDPCFYFMTFSDGTNTLQMMGPSGLSYSNNPSGWWRVQKDGTDVALADLAYSYPITAGGKPGGYMPSVMLTVDGSNIVTSAEIKWYYYNEADGVYQEVADFTEFNKTISLVMLSANDFDQSPPLRELQVFSDNTYQYSFTNSWHYYGSGDSPELNCLAITYMVGNVAYSVYIDPR